MFSYSRLVIVLLILSLACYPHSASILQQPANGPQRQLILLTATVKNGAGEYVMGLERNAFELADEKELRAVAFLESADKPFSLGVLIDTSESMVFPDRKEFGQADVLAKAISGFPKLSHKDNEYFLMSLVGKARLVGDWMNGKAWLDSTTEFKQEKGSTALFDACLGGLAKLESGHYSKKVLVVVTDGIDSGSKHTLNDVKESLRHSDVILYGILVRNVMDLSSQPIEGELVMTELSNATGGETLIAKNLGQLERAVETIAVQLRHQYLVGFQSAGGPPNKWHRVNLRVSTAVNGHPEFSKLSVRTRRGYFSR